MALEESPLGKQVMGRSDKGHGVSGHFSPSNLLPSIALSHPTKNIKSVSKKAEQAWQAIKLGRAPPTEANIPWHTTVPTDGYICDFHSARSWVSAQITL